MAGFGFVLCGGHTACVRRRVIHYLMISSDSPLGYDTTVKIIAKVRRAI